MVGRRVEKRGLRLGGFEPLGGMVVEHLLGSRLQHEVEPRGILGPVKVGIDALTGPEPLVVIIPSPERTVAGFLHEQPA